MLAMKVLDTNTLANKVRFLLFQLCELFRALDKGLLIISQRLGIAFKTHLMNKLLFSNPGEDPDFCQSGQGFLWFVSQVRTNPPVYSRSDLFACCSSCLETIDPTRRPLCTMESDSTKYLGTCKSMPYPSPHVSEQNTEAAVACLQTSKENAKQIFYSLLELQLIAECDKPQNSWNQIQLWQMETTMFREQ